jgi:alpha-beta hydrolase superfamily lysophospholipase
LLLIHGLGEHSGRYQNLVEVIRGTGVSVLAYDLRGHGLSGGPRGDVSAFPRFLEDLLLMEEVLRVEIPGNLPRLLLGHSLGGLIGLTRLRTLGGRASGWLFPRIPVPNGIGPARLTRDPEMKKAWHEDALIHGRLTGGLFREAERVQRELLDQEFSPKIPLLFLLPEADPVVDTGVTKKFARGIVGADVRIEILEGRLHEPFNDLGRKEVFGIVVDWLSEILDGPALRR